MAALSFIMRCLTPLEALRIVLILVFATILLLINNSVWADNSYGIQVGAYRDLDNAVAQVNYLKRLGYEAFYRYETVKDKGKWYRVYIGKYSTRKSAQEEARVLNDLELIDAYSIRLLRGEPSMAAAPTTPTPEQEKPIPESPPAPKKESEGAAYVLHVSSFKDKQHAEEEAGRLERAGMQAFYVDESLAGGRWFRVYIGGFATEKEARTAGDKLKKQGTLSYYKPLKIDRAALSDKQ